ncbi:pyridoxamine 5'-phosphate oxidase family protein [Candidatus Methylacidiphilum fumarolicum]|uniref:Pyridoxamine 5'-phosphate oxidase N-terminal domain-containing protein n=2 Tax=Candidatus Methylacidiphilum fumarolicum TaxID=591154 RepID=I0K1F0_METFB|nr:pyridoxamine 5'-phosphate oxidase family protein [Candidatus Methylacidiphilum fumarolicum]MBW6414924.1 pyridoxamine 5'-phosphate oxidase family protein [Candidatus Methylacidiphilum fumarolicum]TFE70382.1 pyridoxamine 5'-phosphate oxidase [Candidatus Methylacidiphilum fumarolicum]TFE73937.1 pyridoxamine 5'-phosphate oxidase family protein [Candidatus Methylacidiphilum fumarolicum]TFE74444.1 pyridoxamine 5'-phosphate oxidase family protein [Candidatus Methylacidiphilum fumarolicum]TFE77895.
MGKSYKEITNELQDFIVNQKIFFVATATATSRINLSPKGLDTLRIISPKKILWLNLTGSGNETAAHLTTDGRITLMFCSFEGKPLILRLYGKGRVIHPWEEQWGEFIILFPAFPGARQIIQVDVDLVTTSCGFGVPLFEFKGNRDNLIQWTRKKGENGIRTYWKEKNAKSIDGIPTPFFDDSFLVPKRKEEATSHES